MDENPREIKPDIIKRQAQMFLDVLEGRWPPPRVADECADLDELNAAVNRREA